MINRIQNKNFVYIICMYTVFIYYVYINTHIQYIFGKYLHVLELGGIPVHTGYRCLFFLRYEFLKYRNTGVI